MNAIAQLAAHQGIQATELDPGVWMFEAVDDMGDHFEQQDAQDLEKTLAAGRLQAVGGGV